jgi:hypothetical protein
MKSTIRAGGLLLVAVGITLAQQINVSDEVGLMGAFLTKETFLRASRLPL